MLEELEELDESLASFTSSNLSKSRRQELLDLEVLDAVDVAAGGGPRLAGTARLILLGATWDAQNFSSCAASEFAARSRSSRTLLVRRVALATVWIGIRCDGRRAA